MVFWRHSSHWLVTFSARKVFTFISRPLLSQVSVCGTLLMWKSTFWSVYMYLNLQTRFATFFFFSVTMNEALVCCLRFSFSSIFILLSLELTLHAHWITLILFWFLFFSLSLSLYFSSFYSCLFVSCKMCYVCFANTHDVNYDHLVKRTCVMLVV